MCSRIVQVYRNGYMPQEHVPMYKGTGLLQEYRGIVVVQVYNWYSICTAVQGYRSNTAVQE
jgi:hypothetical protein